ncbi:MAG: LysR family transcriptional regulator, partial [Acidimicrobiia bacterium]|nr:LysR family transcriptional regulator [Acidimicrobiia bacterium]
MVLSDRWLRTFVAVAESGSFTAAGRRLGVGQPAVSHAISRLESTLGVRLVERSSRGLDLTPAGIFLHDRLAAAFADVDAALRTVSADASSNVVTLSVSTSLA